MNKCQKKSCTKAELCKCRKVRHAYTPVIWVMGGPGSGKKNQSKKIITKYNFDIIHAAAIFRDEVSEGTGKGDEFEGLIQSGQLIPDQDVIEILERTMSKLAKKSKGFTVISFPKTMEQTVLFEQFIAPVDLIIHLDCKEETMIKRTLERRVDVGQTAHREDNEVTVRIRIETFNNILPKIYKKYESIIKVVDSEVDEQKVFVEICKLIDQLIQDKKQQSKEAQEASKEENDANETKDLKDTKAPQETNKSKESEQ